MVEATATPQVEVALKHPKVKLIANALGTPPPEVIDKAVSARLVSDADEARHTGVSAEAYWDSRASFWDTYFDWNRYPTMAAIWEAGGFDDPAGWDFDRMLDRLLTGVQQLAAVS